MTLESARRRALNAGALLKFYRNNPQGATSMDFIPGFGKTQKIKQALPALLDIFPRVHFATSQHKILAEVVQGLERLDPWLELRRDDACCGTERAYDWRKLYNLRLGEIGKATICRDCPSKNTCPWFHQSDASEHKLTLQTQHHLFQSLNEVAADDLVILDETIFLDFPISHKISRQDLQAFKETVEEIKSLQPLLDSVDRLLKGKSPLGIELPAPRDRFRLLMALQRNEVPNLLDFVIKARTVKLIHLSQCIYYTQHPKINGALLVAGFNLNPTLLGYYFSRPFTSVLPQVKYQHPRSKFYCLASTSTSFNKFYRNKRSRQGIYRYAAAKISANYQARKKTLLVAKAKLIPIILKELPAFLEEPHRLVHYKATSRVAFDGMNAIPIIQYGIEGINVFQDYSTVICLTAYNISAAILKTQLQHLGLGLDRDVEIKRHPETGVRIALTDPPEPLVSAIFNHLEANRIYQAVARIRPWTTGGEVFFAGFQSFPEAQIFQSVPDLRRELGMDIFSKISRQCRVYRAKGLTLKQIAALIGRSERTVRRYLKRGENE